MRKKFFLSVMVFAMLFNLIQAIAANGAAAEEDFDDMIVWYKFDQVNGTKVADASGHGRDAAIVGNSSQVSFVDGRKGKAVNLAGTTTSNGYLQLPANILTGVDNITVSAWVYYRQAQNYTRIFDFGNNTTRNMYLTPSGNNSGAIGLAFAITNSGSGGEQKMGKGTALATGVWKHVALVMNGSTGVIYEDGVKVAEKTNFTLKPSSMEPAALNFIGKSQYGDPTFKGMIEDFRVYNRALSAAEIVGLMDMSESDIVAADKAAINLGNLFTVENDLVLPKQGVYGSSIAWQSSNPGVISNDGKVARPEPEQKDIEVTLTATITKGAASDTRTFVATVLRQLSDREKVELDKASLNLSNLGAVTSDLKLLTQGSQQGSVITWESSHPDIIASDGKVTRPAPRTGDATVVLTATITNGAASDTKQFTATVLEEPFVLIVTGFEKVNAETAVGIAPQLPDEVTALYNDEETKRNRKVTWEAIDSSSYAATGTFTVKGTVTGTDIKPVATVKVRTAVFHSSFNMSGLSSGETLTATVKAMNSGERDLPALLSLALYDASNRMKDVVYASKVVEAGSSGEFTVSMTLPLDVTGHKTKLFVWEGSDIKTSSMQPLADAAQLLERSIPSTPTGLTATAAEDSPEITVTWDQSGGAAGYDLEIDGKVISDVNSPYEHTQLLYNSTHTYAVRAKNSLGNSAWSTTVSATTMPVTANFAAQPFGLGDVTLQTSPFTANRDREYAFLDSLNLDRMLYNFRVAANMDTKGATALTGWDAPNDKLRGHSTGHFLTGIAQAYASSGDVKWKNKIDYMVSELGKIQDELPKQPNGMTGTTLGTQNPDLIKNNNPGFLSGYPERQFILLENGATYISGATDTTNLNSVWAPYYTLHKIMAGLLDCYKVAGNEQALEILVKMADWVDGRLSKLPESTLSNMWSRYIAGEYGGMNETLAELSAVTGDAKYVKTAKYFNNPTLWDPTSRNQDILNGKHANQHIPQFIGALKIFDQTNDSYYYDVANNLWEMIVPHRTFSNGGNGQGEILRERDKIAQYISSNDAEQCSTYNMLKLTRQLFFHNPDVKYMDYYEKALYNHILASQDQSANNGGTAYFTPLNPGGQKSYGRTGFTCDGGTSLESHTKYQDSIYFRSSDKSAVYVNLYMPSTLHWEEKGFTIVQTTNWPSEQGSTLTVNGSGALDIKLRVPNWATSGFTVKVNGEVQDLAAAPSSYVTLSRTWSAGDKIEIAMPYSFYLDRTPDDPSKASIFYGPILMVGKDNSTNWITLNLNTSDLSQSIKPTDTPMNFTVNGVTLVPMYTAYNFRYHAYFIINSN